ncbi:hemin ABC transporter substrate-binding protein [Advenella sp. S44]|uniref:heme/hemin ABC transporter substrate-binding protein n=1 Tax=Advenella sp. S44 TaxID=1982755 RepID=UPI000CBFF368|nr:helical backbone metal receptor [Advenella sp. S44]PJX22417.1 hemin ABC transporter substrate-binding protein [Advenella sp. S44]
MKKIAIARCLAVLAVVSFFCGGASAQQAQRIVSLGGTVTEIIYDLGMQDKLVADDQSSLYPEAATKLPRVGYYRAVPAEGVLSLKPDLVIASENAGPAASLEKVRSVGVEVITVSDKPTIESLYERIEQIAQALGVPEKGKLLATDIQAKVKQAQAGTSDSLRTVLIINRTGAKLMAGGDTTASAIMEMAGLDNVLKAQRGYKPVSAESLLSLKPEMIIVTSGSLEAAGGMDKFKSDPAIAFTPAVKNNRIVVMDDLLALGLGPRVSVAISQLKAAAGHAN